LFDCLVFVMFYFSIVHVHDLQVRWVVESENARIKRFKMLATVLPCNQVPYIGDCEDCLCAVQHVHAPSKLTITDEG